MKAPPFAAALPLAFLLAAGCDSGGGGAAAPSLAIDESSLLQNPDGSRAIPVTYRVAGGGSPRIVFQWRREGESFPALPSDPAELEALLADTELARAKQVCASDPGPVRGTIVPSGENAVRLPELASGEAALLAGGVAGASLEILRASTVPGPLSPSWSANALAGPVSALPLRDGISALVLDGEGRGLWRLCELELSTGSLRQITSGPEEPDALALERGQRSALVAVHEGETWKLLRVELESAAETLLLSRSDPVEGGAIRGLALLGDDTALATAGSSLLRLDWSDPENPRAATILTGLALPWGIALDPQDGGRLYLAERDAGEGQVSALDLNTLAREPVARAQGASALPRPTAIALERAGERLLVLCEPTPGSFELRGLALVDGHGSDSFLLAPFGPRPSSVAAGAADLRLVSLTEADDLAAGGGILQRRAIERYDPLTQTVQVAEPFKPALTALQRWRIRSDPFLDPRPADGARRSFPWDSRAAGAGARVFLRATVVGEPGRSSETVTAKELVPPAFEEPLILGGQLTSIGPYSVVPADLDGDGDLDLASANIVADDLTLFFQGARGAFEPTPAVVGGAGTTDSPLSVAAADLDGDQDLDLVSANLGGDSLTVFPQFVPGLFDPNPLTLGRTVLESPGFVTPVDLEGDGDLDLVAHSSSFRNPRSYMLLFLQSEPGSFEPEVLSSRNGLTFAAAGDLDGDGDLDLVGIDSGGSLLSVFSQTVPAQFDEGLEIPVPGDSSRNAYPITVAAADLDGDGDVDLATSNHNAYSATVFLQTAPGTFTTDPQELGEEEEGSYASSYSIAVADLDGDGDLDLATPNYIESYVNIFLQGAPGVFDHVPFEFGDATTTPFPRSLAAGDLDGDGDQDLVTANAESSTLTVFHQQSGRGFRGPGAELGGSGATGDPRSVAAGDLDGDGDLDLAAADRALDRLAVFFQGAPGRFDAAPLFLASAATESPSSVTAADLDGDGDLDLASAGERSDALTVFLQSAPGRFAAPLVLGGPGTTTAPRSLAAADLDRDGDLDLVAASEETDRLTIFFQVAPGRFELRPLLLGGPGITDAPQWVAAADLDGDADQDLVSANAGSDDLTLFFQVAPGRFGSPPLALGGPGTMDAPRSVAAADLDGDGDLDLVSANEVSDDVTVFFQSAPGRFDLAPLVLGGAGTTDAPRSVAIADADGDGDPDLVLASSGAQGLKLFLQTAPGRFDPPLALALDPSTVTAADLDRDGEIDLVAASVVTDSLSIFWGGR